MTAFVIVVGEIFGDDRHQLDYITFHSNILRGYYEESNLNVI